MDLENYKKYLKTVEPKKKLFNLKIIFIKFVNMFWDDYFDKSDPTFSSKNKRIMNFLRKFFNYYVYNFINKKIILF